jgi:hypothetical protein
MRTRGRILLHVGVQKTGSTYLQIRMRTHADALRAQGVYVPVLPAVAPMMGNAKLLATVLNGAPSAPFRHVFPNVDVSSLDPAAVAAELLADWRPEREAVVLSAEIFRPEHAARVRAVLPPWADVAVVLFVRRQDLWIESYYRQLVKTSEARGDLSAFVTAVLARTDERLCYPDWWLHHQAWHRAFGNCNAVVFDEAKDDLFAALFTAAGFPVPRGIPDVPPQQVALDLHQIAYLLSQAAPLPFAEFARRRAASVEASRRLGAPQPRSLLLPADRARLAAVFAESNRRFLAAAGRPLDTFAMAPATREPITLADVYASEAFVRHKALADDLLAAS